MSPTIAEAAQDYHDRRKWKPVPISRKTKKPIRKKVAGAAIRPGAVRRQQPERRHPTRRTIRRGLWQDILCSGAGANSDQRAVCRADHAAWRCARRGGRAGSR